MSWWDILVTLLIGYPLAPEMVDPRFPLFLQRSGGLLLTLLITLLSLGAGAVIGTALALCRRKGSADPRTGRFGRTIERVLRALSAAFVEGVRGLPIMLLVLLAFHLPYRVAELRMPGVVLAVGAFSLYAAVYFSEIMRAGFRSIDPQLCQVGRVLGLTPARILWKIELPLVGRNMTPDLINLAVTVFKDTSTLAVVAVPEMTYIGRQAFMSAPVDYQMILFLTLVLYWVPATILSTLAFRAGRLRVLSGEAADVPPRLTRRFAD